MVERPAVAIAIMHVAAALRGAPIEVAHALADGRPRVSALSEGIAHAVWRRPPILRMHRLWKAWRAVALCCGALYRGGASQGGGASTPAPPLLLARATVCAVPSVSRAQPALEPVGEEVDHVLGAEPALEGVHAVQRHIAQ